MNIAIIGLGYVGLPLAQELSKTFRVVGYDLKKSKIKQLKNGIDYTNLNKKFSVKKKLTFTNDLSEIKTSNVFIICVPTPVYKNKNPDIRLLENVFYNLSKIIKKKDIVISESTVYPGLTEFLAKKYLQKKNFKLNKDFFLGYSPERINPGDKKNTIKNIYKIIASSDKNTLTKIKKIYSTITKKIYSVDKIEIAESAKIIENAQRDINIAFINEITKILIKNKIPVYKVLKAASTKWNFLNFKPGLVGGHCIGVDPYYLDYFSKQSRVKSEVIISGRKTNDQMSNFFLNEFLKNLEKISFKKNRMIKILILGITFKENINDFRNSKIISIYKKMKNLNKKLSIDVYDPHVDRKEIYKLEKIKILKVLNKNKYDAFFLGTKHKYFKKNYNIILNKHSFKHSFVYDIFNFLEPIKNKIKIKHITI